MRCWELAVVYMISYIPEVISDALYPTFCVQFVYGRENKATRYIFVYFSLCRS